MGRNCASKRERKRMEFFAIKAGTTQVEENLARPRKEGMDTPSCCSHKGDFSEYISLTRGDNELTGEEREGQKVGRRNVGRIKHTIDEMRG